MADSLAERWLRIPVALRQRPQWCITPGTDDDKAPRTVAGRLADSTDPTTWTDFDTACRTAAERSWHVGYMLQESDPFACIDLDVKDGTPEIHVQWYQDIIRSLDSYTERSRSGRGWHVFVEGSIGKGRRRDGVEVYSQERFIICTGDVERNVPIAGRQELLANMVKQMTPEAPDDIELWGDEVPDLALAERASMADGEFGRLFRGEWEGRYQSQSEADLALVKLLLPLTDSPNECWLTFRLSKLGERDKARRSDYAKSTLALAMQHCANDASSAQHGQSMADGLFWRGPAPHSGRQFRLLLDGDLDQLPPLRWLVKRIIPDAGIGAIYGDSGTFKSFLTLDLMAHISNGQEWFGHRVTSAPAVYVPFEGQGGIPNRVKAWRLAQAMRRNPEMLLTVIPPDDIRSHIAVIMEPINLREQADRDALVATLMENGWAGGILCIDTLAHASAGLDENSSAMGEMLTIFRELQHRLGGVILLIHHSGKDASRGMRGWSGLHAAMDFVVECQRDKDDPALAAEFVLTKVKDDSTGIRTPFVLHSIQIGIDEDGDYMSSLVVAPTQACETPGGEHPFKSEANDAEDDQFVWDWVKREVERGEFPSGRSLEGQRQNQMNQERKLTQARLRDAIHRLRAASRLVDADEKAPSGNTYMLTQ